MEKNIEALKKIPVEELGLKSSVIKILKKTNIYTAFDLIDTPLNQLMKEDGIGQKTMTSIKKVVFDLLNEDNHKNNLTSLVNTEVICSENKKQTRISSSNIEEPNYLNKGEIKLFLPEDEKTDNSIKSLGLSIRTQNVLRRNGIATIDKLASLEQLKY